MNEPAGAAARPHVEIYTDGGCKPNPGPGGFGVVWLHPKKRAEASGGFRLTTNNRMEIYAAIRGLELLKRPCSVTLYTDSQYLVNAMMAGWVDAWQKRGWWRTKTERVANIDLWQRLVELRERHRVRFLWVRGHAGNQENERCDQLSYTALRQPHLPPDEGYERKPSDDGDHLSLALEERADRKHATPGTKPKGQKKHPMAVAGGD